MKTSCLQLFKQWRQVLNTSKMTSNLLLWVLYCVSARIFFLEKNTTRYHRLKSILVTSPSSLVPKASQHSILPMAQPNTSVSIRVWHSGSKYRRIRALVKISYKQLKVVLASGVRKLGLAFIALKLGEFSIFDSFFDFLLFDLDDFRNLVNFWLSGLLVFGSTQFDLLPPLVSSTSLAASTLVSSISLAVNTYNDMIVFSIDMSGAAILLKLLIN